jgi:hypothetical protein
MTLEPDADIRDVSPLALPRNVLDPMSEQIEFPAQRRLGPEVMAENPDHQEDN